MNVDLPAPSNPPPGNADATLAVAPAKGHADNHPPHARLKLHRNFRSSFLPDARNLVVYLPPQYAAEPKRHFPVLYLQDGQNLFDPRTSFIQGRTWQVRESADAAIEAGLVEPLIIVGIYNTGDRLYGQLLVEELLPFIGKHYRTLTGPARTGLGGSSLGGLVSLFLGIEYPQVFGRLAVLSPSVWWNHRSILNTLRDKAFSKGEVHEHPRIWLDVGDSEGARTLEDARRLQRQLLRQGWRQDADLHFEVFPGGKHDETSWAARVEPMLRFLFPADK
jgi:enterochelin esterase-like enzyme